MSALLIHLIFAILTTCTSVKGTTPYVWTKVSSQPSDPQQSLTFYLMVKQDQQALQELQSIFLKVTNPESDEHQNWRTRSEINAILKPNSKALSTTKRWIEKQAFTSAQLIGNDAFEITATIEQASKTFSAQFQPYMHSTSGKIIHRTAEDIRLPEEIDSHVDFFLGLNDFILTESISQPLELTDKQTAGKDAIVGVITPQFVLQYYNVTNVLQTGLPSPVSQGSLQFVSQYYSKADLRQYLESLDIPFNPIGKHHLRGVNVQKDPGAETMLDVEQMTGINPLAETWYFNYNTKRMKDFNLYTTVVRLNQLRKLPQVISISYGGPERGLCTFVSECDEKRVDTARKYIQRTEIEFLKLALRGITVFVASGDRGANGDVPKSYSNCMNKVFYPVYPGTSAFVTSVGATELVKVTHGALRDTPPICSNFSAPYYCASGGEEVAVKDFFVGGGGFSQVISRPSYQNDTVNYYLRHNHCNEGRRPNRCPHASMYNQQGRAFPDVSAFGQYGYYVRKGKAGLVGGTSMSSPMWAGIASILNSYAIGLTNRTLGFLNPLLYKMAKECPNCFNDITSGNNICAKNECLHRCRGFEAEAGWDPVTGLGSPNAGKMLEYITKLLEEK